MTTAIGRDRSQAKDVMGTGLCRSTAKVGRVFRRLSDDRRGNVLAMTAAAIFPLMAMIGGAIDLSRLYMTNTRLQQACDAGALAARRTMADVNTLSESERKIAVNYFKFNFPDNAYSAGTPVPTYTRGAVGTVAGAVSLAVPMTIMKMFGYNTVTLNVTCQSTLVVPNTDVMFVLDVTGSMNDPASSTDTQSKIAGLKQAVKDFYSALGPGTATGAGRIRYGFMPYSSNVNVGKIVYRLNASYIAGGGGSELVPYQTRVAKLSDEYYATSYGPESARTPAGSSDSSPSYGAWANLNKAYGSYPATTSDSDPNCSNKSAPPAETTATGSPGATSSSAETVTYPDSSQTTTYSTPTSKTMRKYRYARNTSSCRLQYADGSYTTTSNETTQRSVTWQQKFLSWIYQQKSWDISQIVQNSTGTNPTYFSGYAPDTTPNVNPGTNDNGYYYTTTTDQLVTWGGCIEEAQTVNTITSTTALDDTGGANDLNIDLVPTSTETRWKPYLPQLQYQRNGYWLGRGSGWINLGYAACPREASSLTQYQSDYNSTTKLSASFESYVNSLNAVGGTYHDIGLIWGGRFLSQSGIFSATNADSTGPGGFQISRHIVFMTDGTLDTKPNANDPWGINNLDGRIAPTSTSETGLEAIHKRRTSMICNAMKSKGFTVWVVGFGISTMPQELQDCASDAAHWSLASNSAALKTRFQQIAQTIGGLRLSQ